MGNDPFHNHTLGTFVEQRTSCCMTPGNNDEPKPTAAPMTEPCEADVKAFVERYANIERLTPFRKKQLLRAALGKDKPNPPADDVRVARGSNSPAPKSAEPHCLARNAAAAPAR